MNLPQNMLVSKLIERTTGNMLLVMNSAQPHLGDWKTTLVKQVTTRFSWLLGPDRLPRTTEVRLAGPAAQNNVTNRTGQIWVQILDVLLATVG